MRTIKVVNSPNEKTVKKVLINRSRSGNNIANGLKPTKIRTNISPFRNSIGLKNYQTNAIDQSSGPKVNEEYYQMPKKQLGKAAKQQKKETQMIKKTFEIQKQMINKQKNTNKNIDDKFENSTTESSKCSKQNQEKMSLYESEYLISGYISPTTKLRKLQNQKSIQCKKMIKNLQKILDVEQRIQQSRSKHKLQAQIYQRIIETLKKQRGIKRNSIYSEQDLINSKLKNSGSMETEEGESSHQYYN